MRRAGRKSEVPGNNIPGASAHQSAEDDLTVYDVNIDDPLPDRIGHMKTKEKERDKIEKGRPKDSMLWGKNAGGNNGRDGVRRIVKSVQKIENKGQQDKKKDPGGHGRS
jgi:hypothetical protein